MQQSFTGSLRVERSRLARVFFGGALFLAALPVVAGHPAHFGERHGEWGYDWVAASQVLRGDGSARQGFGVDVERHLAWQLQHGAADHGLDDGLPSQDQEFCSPRFPLFTSPAPYESNRFGSTLLLSEVAVIATIDEGIPGFDREGNPVMLFSLSHGVPLHGTSPIPAYVLAPVDRFVFRGHVFCRSVGPRFWKRSAPPEAGDRIVVIGPWTLGGAVRLGFVLTAALAQIDGDEERLEWPFGWRHPDNPGTMSELRSRVDEAVSGGLFELTRSLVTQEWGSAERRAFGEAWEKHNRGGCRVVKAEHRSGFGVVPVAKICSRTNIRRPRPEADEPPVAAEDGGRQDGESAQDGEAEAADKGPGSADSASPPPA